MSWLLNVWQNANALKVMRTQYDEMDEVFWYVAKTELRSLIQQ